MGSDKRQEALSFLLASSECQGYVTFNNILECADSYSLSLQDFDWLSSCIAARGILIYDSAPIPSSSNDINEYDDFAQTDYNVIFNRVIELDPSLLYFVNKAKKIRPPQVKEISQLKYLVQEGNSHARRRMIEMYIRHAIKLALQRSDQFGLDIADTVGDACTGLIIAVDRYDPDSVTAFASYASLWILQNISREQPTQRPLFYYPVHKKEGYYKAYPMLKQYGCSECQDLNKCEKTREMIRYQQEVLDVEDIISASIPVDSLDGIIDNIMNNSDEDDEKHEWQINQIFHYSNYIIDGDDRANITEDGYLSDVTHYALSLLSPKESRILSLRYGIEDGTEWTLEQVGQEYGVTRERIRQIEVKALRKLRHPMKLKKIREKLGVLPLLPRLGGYCRY